MLGTSGSSGEGAGGGGGGEVAMGSSGDEKGGPSSGGGELYEGDRSTPGNRWPRQETIALLKIRSDMDAAFRDSSLKGPLWEEVSRSVCRLRFIHHSFCFNCFNYFFIFFL